MTAMVDSTEAGIAAIVVTHRSASTIDECLQRLRDARDVADIRVIDNGSGDDTMPIVQRHALADARVRFIANPDNPGFAVACNQGARDSSAPWLAFVNPDLMVDVETLVKLRDAACGLQREALIGAVLHDEQGIEDPSSRRHDPDFAAMLRDASTRDLSVSRDVAQGLQRVDAVSGALMLLPRVLFDRIGGFDEGYRLHAEDLDLCRRVRDAGGVVVCVNDVRVLHLRGVSSRSRPIFVEWHKHRGLWRYFRKFDAARHGAFTRLIVSGAIWARFPLAVMKKLLATD